jgi:DMSO/TMAO reductase YedYZ molybdopterin-dependent catalytic subunit
LTSGPNSAASLLAIGVAIGDDTGGTIVGIGRQPKGPPGDEESIVALISRGFRGRRPDAAHKDRLPPGQYETRDFPVLSAGPTPRTPLAQWAFTLRAVDGRSATWNWDGFNALPRTQLKTDIHCVTKWSRFDTTWEGVSIDTVLVEAAGTRPMCRSTTSPAANR